MSAILGIATGIGGSLITNGFNYFTTRQNNKHEIALIQAKTAERVAEAQARIQEIQIEGEMRQELAAQESFNLSQQYGNKNLVESAAIMKLFDSAWTTWLGCILILFMAAVDIVRAAMRPAITIILMFITGYITYQHLVILGDNLNLVTAATVSEIINGMNYMTFTVVGWWFGDRAIAKRVMKR